MSSKKTHTKVHGLQGKEAMTVILAIPISLEDEGKTWIKWDGQRNMLN